MSQILIAILVVVAGVMAIRAIRRNVASRPAEIQRQKEIARVRQNKLWEDLTVTGAYDVRPLRQRKSALRGQSYFEHNAQ